MPPTTLYPTELTERMIVCALLARLSVHGWLPTHTDTGDDENPYTIVKTPADVLTELFAVDAPVTVTMSDGRNNHGILLVAGNGEDIIADWGGSADDADGFGARMDDVLAYLELAYQEN